MIKSTGQEEPHKKLENTSTFNDYLTLCQEQPNDLLYPLMGACAIALAARSNWLWPAAALAGIPSFLGVIGMVTFAIAVAIVGF